MCDYSLEGFGNRGAEVGELLVLSRFRTQSIGLVDFDNIDCAVCIKPGTRLMLSNIPDTFQNQFRVATVAEVVFGYLPEHKPGQDGYRDGVLFKNDTFVLFQDFDVGVMAKVLSIPNVTQKLDDLFDIEPTDPTPVGQKTLVST